MGGGRYAPGTPSRTYSSSHRAQSQRQNDPPEAQQLPGWLLSWPQDLPSSLLPFPSSFSRPASPACPLTHIPQTSPSVPEGECPLVSPHGSFQVPISASRSQSAGSEPACQLWPERWGCGYSISSRRRFKESGAGEWQCVTNLTVSSSPLLQDSPGLQTVTSVGRQTWCRSRLGVASACF